MRKIQERSIMPDEMDFDDQMDSRKKAFFGRLKKCSHCGMLNTDEGKCPVCGKGKMICV
jgi:rubrerythrin